MNFSIVLNSRQRVNLLSNLLKSIKQTTSNLANVEVFVCVDSDDDETLDSINQFFDDYPFLSFLIVDRSINLHNNLNELIPNIKGKFVLVLNDDCELLNSDWDIQALSILEDYLVGKPDRIVYGRTVDTSVDKGGSKEYASFPVFSIEGIKALGFIMPDYLTGWGGDVATWRMYNGVDRIVDLPCIEIDHVTHNELEKVFNPDETQNFIRVISSQGIDYFTYDISHHIEKLNNGIMGN